MGKSLKGKELGVGISQRKDGLYSARFTSKATGKVRQKYFSKLQECRNWYADAVLQDESGSIFAGENMTVDAWFEYWIENIKEPTVKYNTVRNYRERYRHNIKSVLGKMLLSEVKPLHCQIVLNKMKGKYKQSTMFQVKACMGVMFNDALDNGFIEKNPITKSVKCERTEHKGRDALTIEEQKCFLSEAVSSIHFNQFALMLQTGLRAGEMIGLKWEDVDFKNKILKVRRTTEYSYSLQKWITGTPKSKTSKRDIPLTEEAITILKRQKEKVKGYKVVNMEHKDLVFINENGEPTKHNSYDSVIRSICNRAGIRHFSMHVLRHTFATRCIEGGMRPKTLQMILGHSNISMTMDLYVHVTDNEKQKEVEKIEQFLKIV